MREEMARQDLSNLVADDKDGGDMSMTRVDGPPRFTMPASVVSRLEFKRTRDACSRRIWLAHIQQLGASGRVSTKATPLCLLRASRSPPAASQPANGRAAHNT